MKKIKQILTVLALTILIGGLFTKVASAQTTTTTEPIKTTQPAPQRVDPPMP